MSLTADMSLIDMFEEMEDPTLKLNIAKEEPCFIMDPYCNNDTLSENWQTSESYDLLDSFLSLDHQFNLNDVNMRANTPSDNGLCSTQSLSSDEQLSPILPLEEEQEDVIHSYPQSVTDFDSVNSSNESLESEGSPLWSNVNYDAYSPTATTDVSDVDLQKPPFIIDQSVIDPKVAENISLVEVGEVEQQTTVDYGVEKKQPSGTTVKEAKLTVPTNNKRNIKQFIRVTPIGSGNPRSILLPVSLKDMKEVKTIKIINATQAHQIKRYKISQENINNDNKNNSQGNVKYEARIKVTKNEKDEINFSYPALKLNAEEKRLLQKEGITLPSHYPLTKLEERELKRIRRKIRNKISAQDSRKRKKEYVDGLEDRVKQCHEENVELLKRINILQTENQNLMSQVKKLQAFIKKENKSTHPTTCLFVLLLSLALVATPNLRPHSNSNSTELSQETERSESIPPLAGRSRTLLSTHQLIDEEMQQFEEELPEVEGLLDHDYSPMAEMPPSKRRRYDVIDKRVHSEYIRQGLTKKSHDAILNSSQIRKYIEPPLDDVWPPPKPGENERKLLNQRSFRNDLKINISKPEETRTILLKIPQKE